VNLHDKQPVLRTADEMGRTCPRVCFSVPGLGSPALAWPGSLLDLQNLGSFLELCYQNLPFFGQC
jgi:hypothetical protein